MSDVCLCGADVRQLYKWVCQCVLLTGGDLCRL